MAPTNTDARRRSWLLGATGIAASSTGMERAGKKDPYQVLLIGFDANASVFKFYL